jgi:hypothetical protein
VLDDLRLRATQAHLLEVDAEPGLVHKLLNPDDRRPDLQQVLNIRRDAFVAGVLGQKIGELISLDLGRVDN